MPNSAAGVNGLVKKKMNEALLALIKFASLGERGAVKTFTEKSSKILELAAHGLVTGNQVILTKLPTETAGLVTGRLYTVKKTGVNEIELEEHEGGGVLTWTALGGSVELQQVKECANIKARIAVTLVTNGDGVTEESASKAIETTGAQTGANSITDVLYYEKVTTGEILGIYQLPSKLEESAAAIVTILSTKQNNLVSP